MKYVFLFCFLIISAISANSQSINIDIGAGTTTSDNSPIQRFNNFSASELLYLSSEINSSGSLTGLGFYKASGSTTVTIDSVYIYLKATAATSLTTTSSTAGYTLVYKGAFPNNLFSGWATVNFNVVSSFNYSISSGNLAVLIVRPFQTSTTSRPFYRYSGNAGNRNAWYKSNAIAWSGTMNELSSWRPNIRLVFSQGCAAPASPVATGITTNSAVLNWNQTDTPITYQIKYGAPGFNVNTEGTSIFTATKPYTLNPPLNPSTSYSYYVRAVCNAGDTSAWSVVTNFTTLCNAPSIISTKDSFGCGAGMVTLEATTTSGASVKWYAAATGGAALFTGNSFTTPVINTTTTYYVAAASGTCESSPRQAVVATIRPLPVVQLGNDTTLCPGISLMLDAGNQGGSYIWSPGGQTSQTITTNAAGQYSVDVTVNGCSKKDTIILTPGTLPVNNLPDTTNLCEGDQATLNAGNPGSTYNWTPGGAATQTINVNSGGTYSVDVKSVHGCEITGSTYVAMRPLPVDHLGNDTTICNSDTILLDAGNPGSSYAWNTGAVTRTISAADSGLYTVTTTTSYNCTNSDNIHIAFRPQPHTEGFNFIPRFFEELGKVEFAPLNPENVSGYEWDFGDNTPLVTAMNPTHIYSNSGPYTVTLKVYNECSDFSVRQTIHVDLPTGVVAPGKDDIRVVIYPNPVQSMLNISNQSTDYEMQEVTIFNISGATIYHSKADSKSAHRLSVAHFTSGMYFVKILTDKGLVNKRVQILK